MIERKITPYLKTLAKFFPVVTILGPRQSGKTTLAKSVFENYSKVNLEDKTAREMAIEDPKAFFELYPPPVIIDEVQRVPELLSTIQIMADDSKKRGQFILTGSHQPKLHEGISQSLAGRTGIANLLPLSIAELDNAGISLSRDEYIFNGFMPRLYDESIPPEILYPSYYNTYVERDVRQLINLYNQRSFETFVKLLAGRVGQIINMSSLAGDVGVSVTTLNSWLSVLEASYIIFRLPCYFENFGKRLTKASKVFFVDVGLACSLLGIDSLDKVARDPLLGGLFENLVVLEALKTRYNAGKNAELYYFRTQHQVEVDLLLNDGRRLLPMEIKAGMTYSKSYAENLRKFSSFAKNVKNPTVIYGGETQVTLNGISFTGFKNTSKIISSHDYLDNTHS